MLLCSLNPATGLSALRRLAASLAVDTTHRDVFNGMPEPGLNVVEGRP
jgi:hypothetical protein